jgi:hypothetical protein
MKTVICKSAGDSLDDSSIETTSGNGAAPMLALRNGNTTVRDLIDAYMLVYTGRDPRATSCLVAGEARRFDPVRTRRRC